jgi:hypothetical protein
MSHVEHNGDADGEESTDGNKLEFDCVKGIVPHKHNVYLASGRIDGARLADSPSYMTSNE